MSNIVNLPVLPLDDLVVLPGMVVPVKLDDAEARAAIDAAQAGRGAGEARVLLVPRIDGEYGAAGALAVVEQIGRLPGGERAAVVRATERARIGAGTTGPGAALWVDAEVLSETGSEESAELTKEYRELLTAVLQRRGAWQIIDSVRQIERPSVLADLAGYSPFLTDEQKLWLLETADVSARLEKLIEWTREQIAELDGKPASEEQDYRARVEDADLPEKVREAALSEVDKLERTSDQSPEVGWIRTWLDTLLELPWNTRTEDAYDIAGAREVLDADHAGLDDVKERIIEHLAVRKRRTERGLGVVGGRRSGAVLALVGPPGVGKTSLGESVARSMGRKFVRVALGGVRDEAEIRGHR